MPRGFSAGWTVACSSFGTAGEPTAERDAGEEASKGDGSVPGSCGEPLSFADIATAPKTVSSLIAVTGAAWLTTPTQLFRNDLDPPGPLVKITTGADFTGVTLTTNQITWLARESTMNQLGVYRLDRLTDAPTPGLVFQAYAAPVRPRSARRSCSLRSRASGSPTPTRGRSSLESLTL